jgi:hypothetical protein
MVQLTKATAIGDTSILLNREQKPEECDATEAQSGLKSRAYYLFCTENEYNQPT